MRADNVVKILLVGALTLCVTTTFAQEPDKRALATEPTPYILNRGDLQLEAGLLSLTQDRFNHERSGDRVTSLDLGTTLWRFGVTGRLEVQALVELHRHHRLASSEAEQVHSGFGDVTLRLKQNVWGNDGRATALAVMPYLLIPTNSHDMSFDRVEGGVIAPFMVTFADGYDITAVAEWGYLRDGDDGGYHSEFGSAFTFNHPLSGNWAASQEFASQYSLEVDAPWLATAGIGLSYAVNANMQADAGCSIGLTRATDDVSLSFMLTRRF